MRKVIFIGGTSFSGSTFLDMILANDPKGFSCGEVHALFHPYRPHHKNPRCGCGNNDCNIWQKILKNGEDNLYETIFSLFPNTEFIVDSSKNPFWIKSHIERLKKKNYAVKNLLIWKTPLELAHSFKKRNRIEDWGKSWINYHRLYFTLVGTSKSLQYFSLTNDKCALKNVCDYLNIPYFAGKEKYWEKKHHTLFGNTSAKIHLYPQEKESFREAEQQLIDTSGTSTEQIGHKYKKIYYDTVDGGLRDFVNASINSNKMFSLVEKELLQKGITTNRISRAMSFAESESKVEYTNLSIFFQFVKYKFMMKFFH